MKKLFLLAATGLLFAACQKNEQQPQTYTVNEASSRIEWKGSAPDHFHVGSFDVNGSFSTGSDGLINAGSFTIPIASIKDFDLPDNVKPVLLADLKDNFFKVATHPNASFKITSVKAVAASKDSCLLTGDFTMLGQTHPISFPASIKAIGDSIKTEAKFNLNRLTWGMNNYSDASQKLYILPEINLSLHIRAARKK
ncbi:YceI family protein [Mucilaginibacter limnophilus]|uniref:YceI family protein n=1 Tax=Mucilaginibacter limnophilus TaxID=1932778 RepID=A0A3S2Y488_9SPHI|nr:YceI family protein [Mucilaginibacter limnophilus]RVU03142.1 YceI family protein [Mucilaginibacter limnophilus]